MRRRGRRTPHDDRGLVLLLIAAAMVLILVIAAMVIDLGVKRASVRNDQTVADLSAIAAGGFLAGKGGSTVASNAALACEAAVNSATTNVPSFSPTQSTASTCAVFPVDAKTGCSAASGPVERTFSDARYTLTVRFPIPDSELTDARFTGGVGLNDGTERCQRMKVTFGERLATSFARVIGQNGQTTTASSIVRANTARLGQGVAALLLLERLGCGTLQNSGQAVILVRAPSATNPGVIQSDSAGQVGPCTLNENAGGYPIYGPPLPAGAGPSIIAETSTDGTAGIIAVFGLGISPLGRGASVYPGGINVAPVSSSIASRQPVDDKYNGTGGQITSFHSTAWTRTGWSTATATANGYTVVSTNAECSGTVPAATLTASKIFVSCSTFQPDVNLFPNATDFVVTGDVNVKNGKVLGLPRVRNFMVRGCGACGGGNTSGMAVAGKLIVNSGETTFAAPDPYANGVACSTRSGPGAGGATTSWTQAAVLTGSVGVTGQARLCQTFLYMGAQNSSTYTRQTVTSAGIAPESYPTLTQCEVALPCPKDGVATSAPFSVSGGGSATDWSAPNQLDHQPSATELVSYPFEDLALWSETSSTSVAIKGQAGSQTEGVFFLPNAAATFQGQGTQPILLNAQFLIRKLNMSGQGSLTLSPNAADAVIIPIPGNLALIR